MRKKLVDQALFYCPKITQSNLFTCIFKWFLCLCWFGESKINPQDLSDYQLRMLDYEPRFNKVLDR
jgi:hypothetical protein